MGQETIFLQDSRTPPETKSALAHCVETLSSLITHSGLAAAESSEQNPALTGLTREAAATTAKSLDLAMQCVDLSYIGKLLMQSDLDIVVVKLDLHVRSLNDIYYSGMLATGHALVVPKPGAGACKDDMRSTLGTCSLG